MRRLRRDRSTPAHARTNVRGRVPNNRLPLSLGMLRTATSLQIVPTLRVLLLAPSPPPPRPRSPAPPLSRNFPGVLPRRAHRHTERIQHSRIRDEFSFRSLSRAMNLANQRLARDPRRSYRLHLRTSFYGQSRLINHRPSFAINAATYLSILLYFIFHQHLIHLFY